MKLHIFVFLALAVFIQSCSSGSDDKLDNNSQKFEDNSVIEGYWNSNVCEVSDLVGAPFEAKSVYIEFDEITVDGQKVESYTGTVEIRTEVYTDPTCISGASIDVESEAFRFEIVNREPVEGIDGFSYQYTLQLSDVSGAKGQKLYVLVGFDENNDRVISIYYTQPDSDLLTYNYESAKPPSPPVSTASN